MRQNKHICCEGGGFNCTGYTPWNTERFDISVIQLRNTSAFCRCITRGQNCCSHWMIRVRHIFVSHPPHEKGQVTIWPSLRSAKNVKKQQEVSDLNQDYSPQGPTHICMCKYPVLTSESLHQYQPTWRCCDYEVNPPDNFDKPTRFISIMNRVNPDIFITCSQWQQQLSQGHFY